MKQKTLLIKFWSEKHCQKTHGKRVMILSRSEVFIVKNRIFLNPTFFYGGFRRTVCRTQSWFFWPGKLLVPMTSLRQKMTGFMSPFRIYFHINNIPRQWKVMTVFSVERFPGPPLWRRFSLNWRTYPKIWKLVWKGLLPSFQKSIHCPRDTRSLPFQKNQDCFFSELSTLGG